MKVAPSDTSKNPDVHTPKTRNLLWIARFDDRRKNSIGRHGLIDVIDFSARVIGRIQVWLIGGGVTLWRLPMDGLYSWCKYSVSWPKSILYSLYNTLKISPSRLSIRPFIPTRLTASERVPDLGQHFWSHRQIHEYLVGGQNYSLRNGSNMMTFRQYFELFNNVDLPNDIDRSYRFL